MSVLADLEKLSAAEEFFSYLQVDYDPAQLRVARLHILRRMGVYLAAKDFSSASEEAAFAGAREALQQAYGDFIESSPLDERVFKVLKDHDPDRAVRKTDCAPGAFVPLDQLTVISR
jgi:nitrogenase-stabilizing/protective protein